MTSVDPPIDLFDTHSHVQDRAFNADRDAVLARARAAGVNRLVAVGEDVASSEAAVALARSRPGIWAAVGVHPHNARHAPADLERRLAALVEAPGVVAIGEIGLDYHYDRSPRHVQREVFRRQLDVARARGLPVVIHSREAAEDTLAVLEAWRAEPGAAQDPPGVMHCFGYDWETARRFLALGFTLSIPGTVTYPRADAVREVALRTPVERLVLETDAPVLAPQSRRGKRNEPAFLAETARAVAALRSMRVEDLAALTTANAEVLFRLPASPATAETAAGMKA